MPTVEESARDDLRKKIALEKKLKKSIAATNNKIVRETVRKFAQVGEIQQAAQFNDEIEQKLLDHYIEVGDEFSNQLRPQLPEDILATEEENVAIESALALFFLARAGDQSRFITETNQKNINTAIQFGMTESAAQSVDGVTPSRRDTALLAGIDLKRKLAGRLSVISSTETQDPAEASKATEAEILSGLDPSISVGTTQEGGVNKEWVTAGDEKVRTKPFSHRAADGQEVDISDVYVVGGQFLRWPGDTSLGATAANIMNCRCGSVYDTDDIIAQRRSESVTREPVEISKPKPVISAPADVTLTIDDSGAPIKPQDAQESISTIKKAKPSKKIEPVKKSKKPVKVETQKLIPTDKPPKIQANVKLTGDEDAYIEYYKGSGFYESNEVLRNQSAFSSSQVASAKNMRDSINTAIRKSEIKSDGVLYRGIKSEDVFKNAEKLVGKEIPIFTPQSTATDAGSGIGWSGLLRTKKGKFVTSDPGASVVYKIRTKKGQHALNMESLSVGNTGEREVLLGSGGRYKVAEVRNLTDDAGKITGKVIEVDYIE